MSILATIRNRSGLLLVVIGVGMLAFIGGDFLKATSSGGRESIYVGEVLDEDVLRQAYEVKVEEGINNWKSQNEQSVLTQTVTGQIRSQAWDQYVRELVMNNEYSKLGIDISEDEWIERISGKNVRPEISKEPGFQDTATGKFSGERVLDYVENIDQIDPTGQAKARWDGFREDLSELMKNEKYNALISKAMYVTNEEAKVNFNEKSQNVTFNYVAIPLVSVADSIVEPTESEIKTYYTNHAENYEQDASKDVDFVVFAVVPSAEDDAATKSSIKDLKADFSIYEDYNLMAKRNSDNTAARFTFATKEELQDSNWAELFTAEEGKVIGPYQASQGVYRIAKLAVSQNRPSIHIHSSISKRF